MSKIAFVGDFHLNSTTPLSRLDDYAETTIKKIISVCQTAHSHNASAVILAGDIFHKRQQPISYINKVIEAFNKSPIPVYTIIGNHDLAYDSLDTFPSSPLNTLVQSDSVKLLDTLVIDGHYIKGCQFSEPIHPLPEQSYKSTTLVAHYFYNYTFNPEVDNIKPNSHPDYDFILLGHDHTPYDPVISGKTHILRPGTPVRTTSHSYNTKRAPAIQIIDLDTKEYYTTEIEFQPANLIFSHLVDSKSAIKHISEQILSIRESVTSLLSNDKHSSIYTTLNTLGLKENVHKTIVNYLEEGGIYENTGTD